MIIEPQRIENLSREEWVNIMERSMEDISSVYEETRKIVEDNIMRIYPRPIWR